MLGILIVSHSDEAARGIAHIASEMSRGDVPVCVVGVGGNEDGGLGVSVQKVFDALTDMLPKCDGILIVPDLGSSILSSRTAIGMLPEGDASKILVADAPVLEGAMLAAVEASTGADLAAIAEVAKEARNLEKSAH